MEVTEIFKIPIKIQTPDLKEFYPSTFSTK
jgi:hypothetical protein